MKQQNQRKIAAFTSLVVAAGSIGVIAIYINAGTLAGFSEILSSSPRVMLVVTTAIVSLIIGALLSTSVALGKRSLLIALIISITIYAIAAVQQSILLLFFIWPWSLYKLYRSS